MADPVLEQQLLNELRRLDSTKQQRVLAFVRELAEMGKPRGVPAAELLRFGGLIPREDLEEMRRAIEEECERIDYDEW